MHLTDEQLNEYLDHETNDGIRIEAHISSCADCAARLDMLRDLFMEIESLTELPVSENITHILSSRNLPAPLPRSLTLAVTLQIALAIAAITFSAPLVTESVSAFLSNLPAPSFADLFLHIQTQWTLWLDALSTFQMPSMPEIPIVDVSSLFTMLTVIIVSLLWLIGNGLLLRNQIK